jgi:3-hydroxybutyryl-CoA dehydrogenase
MKILVLATDTQKEEWLAQSATGDGPITWIGNIDDVAKNNAGIIIDLLFEDEPGHEAVLTQSGASLVIINAVTATRAGLPSHFVRINGWPVFLKRAIVEASADESVQEKAISVFSTFNKQVSWVADQPGFISARIVAMIVNEAYLALEENVSSKEEIEIAMKTGTNYPYGPFEWAEKIGVYKIDRLLNALSGQEKRYKPSALLTKEASQ